jgi:hypothetical protein
MLHDAYADYMSVWPYGHINNIKISLQYSSIENITGLYNMIIKSEYFKNLYNFNDLYKFKVNELCITLNNEIISRHNHNENRHNLSIKAPEFIPNNMNSNNILKNKNSNY